MLKQHKYDYIHLLQYIDNIIMDSRIEYKNFKR